MPTSHAEGIKSTPGVQDITWANWFGGVYKDPQNFFAQFAIEPESYLRLYPEIELTPEDRKAFLDDRTGCIVGDGLAKRFGFKVGDKVTLQVGIPIYGTRDFDFNVRGIYKSGGAAVDNQSMFFHWKYADERSIQPGQIGWFIAQISNPDEATQVATAIDQKFANSPNETKTDTEKQFQATFVSMFGNLNLLLGSIALAVVITTLFVAGNTMAMSVRERTTEIAVMRTLGFPSSTIFLLIAGEGLMMAIVGGILGVGFARLIVTPDLMQAGAFIPVFGVNNTNAVTALLLSAGIGIFAGLIPATMASRLKIVDALRRVA
jgi:putative ABC transport system permease protein